MRSVAPFLGKDLSLAAISLEHIRFLWSCWIGSIARSSSRRRRRKKKGLAMVERMGHNVKPMPQLNQQSTKELNMTVLQRMDRDVVDILTTAGHVTLYEFNTESNQWSRKDVEGSLFVVKRRTQPRFQFIVMNRRSTENLVEDLLSDFEYDTQVPYLLYRNAAQEVNGIWFYNPGECEEVAKLFSRILNAFSKVPLKPKSFTPQSTEFQELEAFPTAAIVEGPLEPPITSAVSDAPDPLERLFNNSLHLNPPTEIAPLGISWPSAATHSSSSVLPSSFTSAAPSPMPVSSSGSLSATSFLTPIPPFHSIDSLDNSSSTRTTLLKPSFFAPTSQSTAAAAAPFVSPALQPSVGAPLLQPFPPPAPPASLTPSLSSVQGAAITREGIRDALFRLLQDDHFIDIVYREMLNAHTR
ncbi:hypothetical protein O6H91_02G000600 [Diphasiastrum complanatum]|uniref:Uncharacterized protein n=1 Tax=Diphasiastrum complanatum TaxID=34168 RepID=A0ACC2ECB1_DIPCM|nr:hypothetical protein O6H91_02G000600 [Diphasiastrum complanatum]